MKFLLKTRATVIRTEDNQFIPGVWIQVNDGIPKIEKYEEYQTDSEKDAKLFALKLRKDWVEWANDLVKQQTDELNKYLPDDIKVKFKLGEEY